jgi:hypothetical protein
MSSCLQHRRKAGKHSGQKGSRAPSPGGQQGEVTWRNFMSIEHILLIAGAEKV